MSIDRPISRFSANEAHGEFAQEDAQKSRNLNQQKFNRTASMAQMFGCRVKPVRSYYIDHTGKDKAYYDKFIKGREQPDSVYQYPLPPGMERREKPYHPFLNALFNRLKGLPYYSQFWPQNYTPGYSYPYQYYPQYGPNYGYNEPSYYYPQYSYYPQQQYYPNSPVGYYQSQLPYYHYQYNPYQYPQAQHSYLPYQPHLYPRYLENQSYYNRPGPCG